MHVVMIGGSDAGISAALRARELDPAADVTVVLEDAYPNFSICGIPYYVSGEVTQWRDLAHRTVADLEGAGMRLRLDTTARRIDVPGRKLLLTSAPAGAPATAGPTPVGWRENPESEDRQTYSQSPGFLRAGAASLLPLRNCPRPVRTRQGRL
jgi:NADPH-dependent 2,4-dienoyl-CoA reductase/sulfur reductase-like enzyme